MHYQLLLLPFIYLSGTFGAQYEDLKTLEGDLFKGYSTNLRPVNQSSDTVLVEVELALSKVVELDVTKEVLVTWLEFNIRWIDQRLHWDDHGIKTLRVPTSKVWVPELHLLRSSHKDKTLRGHEVLQISHKGEVRWHGEMKTKTWCTMNVHKFPFDQQTCSITMTTLNQFQDDVNITDVNYSDSEVEVNGEWTIKSVRADRMTVQEDGNTKPAVSLMFKLERRAMYYIYTVLMPMITVFIVNPFVFLVKAKSGEKISTAVTLFLSLTIFISLLSGMVPQTSTSVPFIYILVYVQFQMSAGIVISCILTNRICNLQKPNLYVRLITCMLRIKKSRKVIDVAPPADRDTDKDGVSKGDNSDDEPFDGKHLVERYDRALFIIHMIITMFFVISAFLILFF